MTQWKKHSRRKPTGGLLKHETKKRRHQRGRDFLPAHIGAPRIRPLRTRGGRQKMLVLATNVANVSVAGKARTAAITSVLENSANPQYIRRNIITKGAIIQTDIGKARVTSRPGSDGAVNAVLVEAETKAAAKKK